MTVDLTGAAPLLGLVAGVVAVACTVPYVRDIARRTTVPHRGSWLIWSTLEVVAVEAQRADGARWSLVPLVAQCLGTCLVFALSIRLGSGGLSRVDLSLLALAGVGVAGWLVVDVPVIATTCVIAADLVAALMMAPKAWRDPHSETLSTYALASVSGVFAAGAVATLSLRLLAYPLYFVAINAALSWVILAARRRLARREVRTPVAVPEPAVELATAGLAG
jgi:hypothetical protein